MTTRSITPTRTMTSTRLVLALAAAGMLGGAGAAFVAGSRAHAGAPSTMVAATPAAIAAPDFAQIARRYGPAVVNISVSGMKKVSDDETGDAPTAQRRGAPGMDPNDPFFEFFKRFQGPNGGFGGPREMPMRGQGSGFIVSADGTILTNAHVVRDAKDVTVKLTDRREFQAKVLGIDAKTDVAVLKIDAKNLPTLPLGNPRDLAVGEWVLAIGSPFGFENSVTAGVVSAKGRSLPDDSFVPFIQTDVAVNPGNSGGPLFNARGEVVGINSQIFSRTGGYQGLSFAIPIDLATKVKDQIVATGKASHARLGVAIQEVNQALADSFKLDRPEGALVSNVDAGGPADKAGLKTGDVIRKVNGQAIVASGDLPALIGQSTPGEKVTLEIWRQGKREELSAKLGDANDKKQQVAKADDAVGKGKLGLALRPLQPQEKRAAGVDAGLLVENAAGPAALAGVQPGDLLVGIDGKPVQSIEQVREVVAKSGKSVALLIQRDGNKIFVPVRVG
jgi:serine protease Do